MIAKIYSAIPNGYNGNIIEVEGSTSRSLPTFNIVGMANKTVSEARERVRAAMNNSNLIFPTKKVTVNLAPAELIKTGSHLDLPIALTVALLAQQLQPEDVESKLFIGELSLDGRLKPVRGIINIVEAAHSAGFKEVVLPADNLAQASLIKQITLTPAQTLSEVIFRLRNLPVENVVKITTTDKPRSPTPICPSEITFDQIHGQNLAKRALTIALAGRHNILLYGPPGTGKTLLARAAASLSPPPTHQEQISITKLYSLHDDTDCIISERPFRSPHHSASHIAILGGGPNAQPGEISLAEHGILFLDELPEFSRSVLESLRQPLEDHTITIARANQHLTYPAHFMLIATMNPCPCGYLNDSEHACRCTTQQLAAYRQKVSGPILDRIDMIVHVEKTPTDQLQPGPLEKPSSKTQKSLKSTIEECQQLQLARFHPHEIYNSLLSSRQIDQLPITASARALLERAISALKLSTRTYYKALKVARTIADLDRSPKIKTVHIAEALSFRQHNF